MAVTLQHVVRALEPGYSAARKLHSREARALAGIRHCRTAVLGRHGKLCPNGHLDAVWYNSCQHRACPACAGHQTERWLAHCSAVLLPYPHAQIVLTLPQEYHRLWRFNRRRFGDLVFRVARQSVFEQFAKAEFLAATPGVIAGLHTWGSAGVLHLHVHLLVTHGGLDAEGRWRRARKKLMIAPAVLRATWHKRFREAVERELNAGQLELPPDLSQAGAQALVESTRWKKWSVRVFEPLGDGRGLAKYLARYLRGGPIKDDRLLSFNGEQVTLLYRDHRGAEDGERARSKPMVLKASTLVGRVLLHVPEPNFRMVRGWGLYASNQGERREQARRLLTSSTARPPRRGDDPASPVGITAASSRSEMAPFARRCPVCGAELIVWEQRNGIPRVLRGRSPSSRGSPPPQGLKPYTRCGRKQLLLATVQPEDEADQLPTELNRTATA